VSESDSAPPSVSATEGKGREASENLDRLGCFSFLSALALIWQMRSRVTDTNDTLRMVAVATGFR
jgi:hypothetical protein